MYIGQPIIDNVCNYNSNAACNLHIYLLSRDSNKENIPPNIFCEDKNGRKFNPSNRIQNHKTSTQPGVQKRGVSPGDLFNYNDPG